MTPFSTNCLTAPASDIDGFERERLRNVVNEYLREHLGNGNRRASGRLGLLCPGPENPRSTTYGRGRSGLPLLWAYLSEERAMDWETPTFEEIDMNAEIGSYQGDSEGTEDYDGL